MVLALLERAVVELELPQHRVVVAASGGLDSTVLLHGLARLAGPARIELSVAHVNHGLRGEASEADEQLVRDLAASCALPFCVAHVEPRTLRSGGNSRTRPTLQEAARRLRYDALRKIARETGSDRIATAHHLDDQAETVLMRIFRGCAPAAIGGIPEVSPDGEIVRPLLRAPRSAILDYALKHGLVWREDASNHDPSYTRNRLRQDWLPGLAEAFNPKLARAIAGLAEAQRRDSEWIESVVDAQAEGRFEIMGHDELAIDTRDWGELHEALARRLVARAIRALGGGRDLSRGHLDRVLGFMGESQAARAGACMELPGDLRVRREKGRVRFFRIRGKTESAC